jgi:hypothetical protein
MARVDMVKDRIIWGNCEGYIFGISAARFSGDYFLSEHGKESGLRSQDWNYKKNNKKSIILRLKIIISYVPSMRHNLEYIKSPRNYQNPTCPLETSARADRKNRPRRSPQNSARFNPGLPRCVAFLSAACCS